MSYDSPDIASNGNSTITHSLLFGRDKEISQIFVDIQNNKRFTCWLITGESGIGKSALLEEIYRKITEDLNDYFFVGYYSEKESLIAGESETLIYPFRVALENLANQVKEFQHLGEKIDNTLARVKKGFLKYATEQGKKIGLAILEDVANKVGLKETLEIGKDIVKAIEAEKTGILSAQTFVAEHKDEARESYIEIFKTLLEEFKERQFVLIFDKFEYAGKASIDFFLNFAKFMMFEERFHLIVSFSTDARFITDTSYNALFQALRDKVKKELGGKIIDLQGLSVEDIGKWIKLERGISLPVVPDLQRIKESSAGLPILLSEWIGTTADFKDYERINRERLCDQITKLKSGLSKDEEKNLFRLSILQKPFKDDETLAKYLEIEDPFMIQKLIEKLVGNRIFYELKYNSNYNYSRGSDGWFRHELIKKCFEDTLRNSISKHFHEKAAKFFLELKKNGMDESSRCQRDNLATESNNDSLQTLDNYDIFISLAYHLHMAGTNPAESYKLNKEIAYTAVRTGDLDLAERCFKRALSDTKQLSSQSTNYDKQSILSNEFGCLFDLATNVYLIWGRYDDALSIYQSVLPYFEKVNNLIMKSNVNRNIAIIYHNKGEIDKALELYNLEMSKKMGDPHTIAENLNNIAVIYEEKGEYDHALDLYNQSLEMSKKMGDPHLTVTILNNIAQIHEEKGEYDHALDLYNQSLEILKKIGDLNGIRITCCNTAKLCNKIGLYEAALNLANSVLGSFQRIGDQNWIARTLNVMSNAYYNKCEIDKALDLYNQSLEILKKIGDLNGISLTLNNIAVIYKDKGEYNHALDLYNQSLEISKKIGDQHGISLTLNNIAVIYEVKGEYESALFCVIQAHKILQWLRIPELQRSLSIISSIREKLGFEEFNSLETKVRRKVDGVS